MIVFMFIIHFLIFQVKKEENYDTKKRDFFHLEIYLIACLIDFLSTISTYVQYVIDPVPNILKKRFVSFVSEIEQLLNLEKIFFHFVRYLMMFVIQLIVFI
jgi:hypothetical protein